MPHAHLVFATKCRHASRYVARREETMRDVFSRLETELSEFDGESNQVHLLVNFPPKAALFRLVSSHKGVSSSWIRQEFPDLRRHYGSRR